VVRELARVVGLARAVISASSLTGATGNAAAVAGLAAVGVSALAPTVVSVVVSPPAAAVATPSSRRAPVFAMAATGKTVYFRAADVARIGRT